MGRSSLQIQVKVKSDPMATFSPLLFKSLGKMLRGGWANSFIKNKEGIAVDFLLVWCGRSATTLVPAGHNMIKKLKRLFV
jgi:hypothetical protein